MHGELHEHDLRYAFSRFTRLSKPERLELFKDILRREELQVHPHGFYIFRVMRTNDTDFRVHIWRPGAREFTKTNWLIHNHDKDVKSTILIGTMRNSWFDVPDASFPTNVLYAVEYQGDRYSLRQHNELRKTSRYVEPKLREFAALSEGDEYFVRKFDFHASYVDDRRVTVTFCEFSNKSFEHMHVVGDLGGPERVAFRRKMVTAGDRQRLLEQVASSL